MPTLSKKQLEIGVYRVEATVPVNIHQYVKSLTHNNGLATFGEAIDSLTKQALEKGFEESFNSAKNTNKLSAAQVVLSHNSVLNRILAQYEHQPEKQSVVREIMSAFKTEESKPPIKDKYFIDAHVTKPTHELFKRMSNLYGHKGSKAKIIAAMVDFNQ